MDAIDVGMVTSVLLADGWHEVDAETFTVGEYEYEFRPRGGEPVTWHASGASGICAAGFQFKEYRSEDDSALQMEASWICGPLSAVLGVRVSGGG